MIIKSTLTALFAASLMAAPGHAQTVGVAASGQGSFTFGVASGIAKAVSEKSGVQMRVQPSGGSNIFIPQLNAGFMDFGMSTDYETWLAYKGKLTYKKPNPNIRIVSVMVGLMPGMFVRKGSPVQKISDLKGKRVSSGFASQKIIGEVISAHLANAGMSYADVKGIPAPNVVRAADDFMQSKTDVLFFALGSGAVLKASAKVGGLRFISIDSSDTAWARLKKVIPMAYQRHVKPSKRFHGVTKPSTVMAYDLAINSHAGANADMVYKVTKAIHGNKKIMAGVFRVLNGFSPKRMAKKTVIPYHPGAIKFYKEQGMWPPKG